MAGKGLASRQAAHAALMRVFRQRQTVDQALTAQQQIVAKLDPQDRGFAYTLIMTTLRYQGVCQALVAHYLDRPLKESRLDISLCLHLGICQLMVLKTPAHAAVDASVELAKHCHAPLAGLVNAVLKKIAREGEGWWQSAPLGKLAAPDWLWQSWNAAYGEEIAAAIAAVHLREPSLDITIKNTGESSLWSERLQAEILPQGSLRLPDNVGDVTTLPGFAEGSWWVQDVAASLPVKMLGEVAGREVLDLCAAPGGKTMQLAALGAKVTAVDSSGARLKRLAENLERTRLTAEIIAVDALQWQPSRKYDAILLDAPCSATGTVRRHPEIPWLRTAEEIARLTATQTGLINKARSWLKPGGTLVYAVCSLQPEEGEGHQIAGESRRTLPCDLAEKGGMDGFYMVKTTFP